MSGVGIQLHQRIALEVTALLFFISLRLQTKLKHPSYQAMAKVSLQLAVQFLFHTYLHTKKKLRYGQHWQWPILTT